MHRNFFLRRGSQSPFGGNFLAELLGWSIPNYTSETGLKAEDGRAQLEAYYNEQMRAQTNGFTQRAVRVEDQQKMRLYISAVVLLALLSLAPFFVTLLAAPLAFAWYRWPHIAFRREVKEEFFQLFLPLYGEGFSFAAKGGMSLAALERSGIVPDYDRIHQEDCIRGNYQGVQISLCEVELDKREIKGHGKDQETSYRNVFRGLVVQLEMNKNFAGHTVVKRDAGKLGNVAGGLFNRLERVSLEDPTFEKAFEVYGDNQQEARYLLTPAFMERLLHLEALFDEKRQAHMQSQSFMRKLVTGINSPLSRMFEARANKGIQAAFHHNNLLMTIPTKQNYFEMGRLRAPITFHGEINHIHAEMMDVFAIIKTLKLEERTGI